MATLLRRLRPRRHQVDAIRAAAQHLKCHSRAQETVACGAGKTLIAAELARQRGGTTLVVVPTLELVTQTAGEYARQRVGDLVAVCSDADALDETADVAEVGSTMTSLHGGITTSPAELGAWLQAAAGPLTVVVTYASLPVIVAAHRDHQAPEWKLIVVDEAHRSAGRVDRPWNVVHDNSAIPAQGRLYMTGTPRVMGGDGDDVVSMDNPTIFGEEVYRLGFADAISRRLICDYRVVVSVVTDEEVARFLASAGEVLDVNGRPVPARTVAAQIALLKAANEFGLRRVITFHGRVIRAANFAMTLPGVAEVLGDAGVMCPAVHADWVSGEQSPEHRRAILRVLADAGQESELRVVANARVLGEGVNVPELDGVEFADRRSSPTDVVQAISRALRRGTDPDKVATIVIPVLSVAQESPISALESPEWEPVWQTVRALRAHDERLADWLDAERVRLTHEDPHMPSGLHGLPPWLEVRGAPITPAFVDAIRVRVVSTASSPWWETYGLAAAYYERHRHLLPGDDDERVRAFVANNRSAGQRGQLAVDRRAALDRIGMVWDLQAHMAQKRWDDLVYACDVYRREYGDLQVPQAFRLVDERFPAPGYPLGIRINTIRMQAASVPADVRAQLDGWGMVWNVLDAKFAELLVHAQHWVRSAPGTRPPADGVCCGYYPVGKRLMAKVTQANKGRLPARQRAALEGLGVLTSRSAARRQEFLDACDRWLAGRGAAGVDQPSLDVPVTYIDDQSYNLGDGIAYQRALMAGSIRDRAGKTRRPDDAMVKDLNRRGMIWRAEPVQRGATAAELEQLRGLSGRAQTMAVIALVDEDVTQSSIADALGIKRPTLNVRIKYARKAAGAAPAAAARLAPESRPAAQPASGPVAERRLPARPRFSAASR